MDTVSDSLDPNILRSYSDLLMADLPLSSSPSTATPHLGSIYDSTPLARIEVGQPGDTDVQNHVGTKIVAPAGSMLAMTAIHTVIKGISSLR